jgi:hypothetical protein
MGYAGLPSCMKGDGEPGPNCSLPEPGGAGTPGGKKGLAGEPDMAAFTIRLGEWRATTETKRLTLRRRIDWMAGTPFTLIALFSLLTVQLPELFFLDFLHSARPTWKEGLTNQAQGGKEYGP